MLELEAILFGVAIWLIFRGVASLFYALAGDPSTAFEIERQSAPAKKFR